MKSKYQETWFLDLKKMTIKNPEVFQVYSKAFWIWQKLKSTLRKWRWCKDRSHWTIRESSSLRIRDKQIQTYRRLRKPPCPCFLSVSNKFKLCMELSSNLIGILTTALMAMAILKSRNDKNRARVFYYPNMQTIRAEKTTIRKV